MTLSLGSIPWHHIHAIGGPLHKRKYTERYRYGLVHIKALFVLFFLPVVMKIIVAEEPVHPAPDGLLDPQETDAQRCSAHQTTPVCQGDLPAYRTVLNTMYRAVPPIKVR